MTIRLDRLLWTSLAFIFSGGAALAQAAAGPVYVEPAMAVPQPVDHIFSGVIELNVDATDTQHRIVSVTERIPVGQGGPVTLLYPRWEAASHGPSLSVSDLAGLIVEAEGRRIAWRRDRYEPHAFQLDVPRGAAFIDVRFQIIAQGDLLTPDVVAVPWQRLALYPAGWYARNIALAATLVLRGGLRPFTALKIERTQGSTIRFAKTTLETLLDSRC